MFTHPWIFLPPNLSVLWNNITKWGIKTTLKWNPSNCPWMFQGRKQVSNYIILSAQGDPSNQRFLRNIGFFSYLQMPISEKYNHHQYILVSLLWFMLRYHQFYPSLHLYHHCKSKHSSSTRSKKIMKFKNITQHFEYFSATCAWMPNIHIKQDLPGCLVGAHTN